jgi:hypothetical protein
MPMPEEAGRMRTSEASSFGDVLLEIRIAVTN